MNTLTNKLKQPDLSCLVLPPVMPTRFSPYNQVRQLINAAGSLPGQRTIPGGAEIRFSQNISIVIPKAIGRMNRNFFWEENVRSIVETALRSA